MTLSDINAAILADYHNDDLRMVLADWFEENGQPERAKFIRLDVEVAREGNDLTRAALDIAAKQYWKTTAGAAFRRVRGAWREDSESIQVRMARGFGRDVYGTIAEWMKTGRMVVAEEPIVSLEIADRRPVFSSSLEGGLVKVNTMYCQWIKQSSAPSSWMLASAFVSTSPGTRSRLPDEIFDLLPTDRFPSESEAMVAASEACLKWARKS